ncbi:hypothetical protein HPP92_026520 [Vanilla planifolia]|uniref:Uncharacterized protein n=1 Tax=Vanilla planifolia TaxID=51239 RepID=A0A835U7I0_VANPL|nr:hypothetical protein HPP92_026520 [Vanilla planifolia]
MIQRIFLSRATRKSPGDRNVPFEFSSLLICFAACIRAFSGLLSRHPFLLPPSAKDDGHCRLLEFESIIDSAGAPSICVELSLFRYSFFLEILFLLLTSDVKGKQEYGVILQTADIDEREIRREKPEDLVVVLAEAKADAIMGKLQISKFREEEEPTLLITADQVVLHGGRIREKPSSPVEAREFIKGYSEDHATTIGSVLVTNLKTGTRRGGWDKAEVYFHKIPDDVIETLVNEGDVLYVAGD